MTNQLYGTSPLNHAIGTADVLIAEANKQESGPALRRLGVDVAKGNRFECPTCKGRPPSATFADDTGDITKHWRCTAESCNAGGSIVDLVGLVRGYSDTNAARWVLGLPVLTTTVDIPEAGASLGNQFPKAVNGVVNSLGTIVPKADDDSGQALNTNVSTSDGKAAETVAIATTHAEADEAEVIEEIGTDVPATDGTEPNHAGEIITSTNQANTVEMKLPVLAGNEARAEKKLMRQYSPNGADGPRASSGAAASDLFERAKAVPLANVIDRLNLSRDGHKFLCPFHDDHNPSADFRDGATGNAHSHWQCFACNAKGTGIDLVIKKIGGDAASAARWILGESSPASKNGHAARPKAASKPGESAKGRPPKIHETQDKAISALLYSVRKKMGENWHIVGDPFAYRDAAGEVVLGVVRFEDGKGEKTFRQFSRKGDGWIARGQSEIPPFRLAELDKATPLVIVEGEKTCDAAWEIGLQSTTWAGGSKAVGKTDWLLLSGFDVVIWPDADEPGRKAAEDVAKALHGVAARVRILPDDPDAAKGDDAADVLAEMGQEKALHYFEDRLDRATDWTPPQPAKSGFPQSGDGKPQVFTPLEFNDPMTIFEQIFPHMPDAGIYQREGELCRIVRRDTGNIRGVGSLSVSGPVVEKHDVDSILPDLCKVIDFQAEYLRGGSTDFKAATPDPKTLKWLLRLKHWPGTPQLVGITSGPFLRHDGTVCTTPGYDAASGWYLDYHGEPIEVPDRPTREQAKDACEKLLALVDEFEWKSETQKCGFLAYVLTLPARPGIAGNVPAFVFTGSTPGAGKSLQTNVANIVAYGRKPSGYVAPTHPTDAGAEWKKAFFAFALTGSPSLVVSNYPSGKPVGCAEIDCVITESKIIDRVMRTHETKEVAWVATMAFTGNNLSCSADFEPRSIWAYMEPTWENPRERDGFKIPDLEGYARKHRAELLGYALTILRWHAAENRPKAGGKNFGSFEEWASTVRDPIMHLTGHDVTQNGKDAGIVDHESDGLATLLNGLNDYYEWRKSEGKTPQAFTVADLHADMNHAGNASSWVGLRELVDPSLSLSKFGAIAGKMLAKNKGRVKNGMKLVVNDVNGKRYWRIVRTSDER
jgi:putative DNA primase/helicase